MFTKTKNDVKNYCLAMTIIEVKVNVISVYCTFSEIFCPYPVNNRAFSVCTVLYIYTRTQIFSYYNNNFRSIYVRNVSALMIQTIEIVS